MIPKGAQPITELRIEEVFDALEEIGIITHACEAVGYSRRAFHNMINKRPEYAARAREALAIGAGKRRDYLEALAYSMAPTNPTMVMFLLKREDPSYRESYSVHSTATPTDYVIDLSTDDTPQLADVTPTPLLGE